MAEEGSTPDALGPGELPAAVEARLGPAERRTARRCLSVLGVLSAGSMIGVASSLYLVNNQPLLLIALSPIGRHLILVAPTVDPFAFVAVAVGRRLIFYIASFHLGRALGPTGIVWLEARAARTARFVRWLERLFRRASHVAVFLLPGPAMSTIAGMSEMGVTVFASLAGLGLVFRMLVVLGVAEWLSEPIEQLLGLIAEYWIPGTVVLVIGVAVYRWRRWSRGGDLRSELSSPG
jgi:membrane protein DedA with SNARE-associated domain